MADDNGATQTTNPDVTPPFGPSQPDRSGFPYSGPGDQDWRLPDPQARPPRTAGSPTGPFSTWPPPWRGARVQGFVPSFASRSYQQWGDDRQFQQEPQPWEAPGIFSGVGKSLTQIGSGFVGASAGMMDKYSAAYMGGFAKGQEQAQRLRFEQLKMLAAETAERQAAELNDYRDVFSVFHGDPATGTGADPHLTLKGVGNLWDGLYSVARQYDDKLMIAALDSGNLASAENLLKQRDAKASDLRAAVKAQQDGDSATEANSPYMKNPVDPSGAPSQEHEPASGEGYERGPEGIRIPPQPAPAPAEGPSPTPPAPETPAPDQSATPAPGPPPAPGAGGYVPTLDMGEAAPPAQAQTPKPIQVAEAGMSDAPPSWAGELARQQVAQAAPAGGAQPAPTPSPAANFGWSRDLDAADKAGFDPVRINQLAEQILEGRQPRSDETKGILASEKTGRPSAWQLARRRAIEMQTQFQKILTTNFPTDPKDPSKPNPAVLAAIKSVAPTIGAHVESYANGSNEITKGQETSKPGLSIELQLASKYDPTFTNVQYTRGTTLKNFTSGPNGVTLAAIGTAYKHIAHALDLVKNPPSLIQRKFGGGAITGYFTSDEDARKMGEWSNAINTAFSEYERAITKKGATVTGRALQAEEVDWSKVDPRVIRANLEDKLGALKAQADTLKGQFVSGVGRVPASMYNVFDLAQKDPRSTWGQELGEKGPGAIEGLKGLDNWRPSSLHSLTPLPPGWKIEQVQ
jgi:hypothetical protein